MNIGTESKVNLVPHFVTATTASGLIEAMLSNNLVERAEVKYFDIAFVESAGQWYAWFYKEINLVPRLSKRGKA